MGISDLVLKKKSPEILKALDESPTHVRSLRKRIGGSASTIQTRIREMEEENIIEEKRQDNFPFKKILELTDLGENIADIMRNFEGLEQKRMIETVAFEREKDKLKWPLLFLFKHGEQGNTKIQKLTFLGKHELGIQIPYNFNPYQHGPFSKELAKDMGKLLTLGLVDPLENQYKLTEEGRKLAGEIYENLSSSEKQSIEELEKYSKLSLRRLLNRVYKKYPAESGSPNV
ncbi:hypothetical protein AKJ37_04270 [candidate division MSBL1 archaeon SCGC-AAA259I09]|uniref:HTH hxlR-type domain-containing protein n=1 Tax=candidate division MSBL1 archaeon SCGC-AAA259I09 TaxID=1698267 RepID=A0A133URV3_9EURY|nr:hypothetical protein AKJ37_04270 [candidate division MSBL1 archaeon SCGC-AAA259I09]